MKKGGKKSPPWKSPVQWTALILSLALSLFLIYSMPAGSGMSRKTDRNAIEKSEGKKIPPATAQDKTAEKTSGKAPHAEGSPPPKKHGMGKKSSSFGAKLLDKWDTIGDLLLMVSIAAMIGSIAEARKWHLIFGYILGRFSRLMRLPAIVGIAMPTALYSNVAANSMLVSSHAEGKIGHSSLIAGGMANSYLSYLSHSLRVMYPVIGAIGIPGAFYFGGQFLMGFLFILCVLLWHRRLINKGKEHYEDDSEAAKYDPPLSWKKSFQKGAVRVGTLLFRMLLITVPLMLLVEWMMKKGIFDFWEKYIPDWINRIFPAELMSIVIAQMGGLVQSALVAANLRDHSAITNAQIVLAMLVGSAIGNPFRTLRRNLPSALGIFPTKEAFTIVIGMQLSRIVGVAILITITVFFIHYTH